LVYETSDVDDSHQCRVQGSRSLQDEEDANEKEDKAKQVQANTTTPTVELKVATVEECNEAIDDEYKPLVV
jgi:hypothetical protein